MTVYWIDIENADGVKQGFGPILSATAWTHTAQLDRAGTFSFTMLADDPRRNNLAVKRIARCWTYDGGQLRHLGAGIINDISLRLDAEGAPLLVVSGDDLLHELTYRNVGDLALVDESWFHPCEMYRQGGDINEDDKNLMPNQYNFDLSIDREPGDTTTHENVGTYGFYTVIKATQQFDEIRFILQQAATMPPETATTAFYWNGAAFANLSFTDGTKVGNVSMGQNGSITFTAPADWSIKTGDVGYKVVLFNLVQAGIYDVSLRSQRATETVLGPIMGYAPAGWTLDTANGYYEITGYQEYGANLVINPSFELGAGNVFTGWTIDNTDADDLVEETATAADGSRAVKVTNKADMDPDHPCIYQEITVEDNSAYLLQMDVRGDGANQGIYIITAQMSGTYDPATAARKGFRIVSYNFTGNATTTYQTHSLRFFVPTGVTTLHLQLRGTDFNVNGAAYWDNVRLRKIIGGGDVQLTFANESVLEALIRICETNGEHFILSPSGRQVLWLRNDTRATGVRCVGNVDPQAVEDEEDIALLVNVTESQSAYDLVSRVYPFGGGQGDERATLANCTRGVPDGYTLDKVNNCLIRDASETAYGRIDRRLDLPDIVALNQSPAQLEYASNMLFDRAYTYLRRHSATSTALTAGDVPRAYNLTLAKCDRILLPGHTVKVEYETWYNQTRQLSINRDLWILSSTVRVDETGIHTVALQCATTDTPPMTDAMLISEMLRKQRASFAHAPGV